MELLLVPVSMKATSMQLSSCWSVDLEHTFYYTLRPLIDRAPQNNATSLTTYTMHAHISDTRIYIIIMIYII